METNGSSRVRFIAERENVDDLISLLIYFFHGFPSIILLLRVCRGVCIYVVPFASPSRLGKSAIGTCGAPGRRRNIRYTVLLLLLLLRPGAVTCRGVGGEGG